MFLGTFQTKLLEKSKIQLPTPFVEGFPDNIGFLTTGFENSVIILPKLIFQNIVNAVRHKPITNPIKRNFRRFFFTNAQQFFIDDSNAITIPPYFLEDFNITNELVLTGCIDYIEIWDSKAFYEIPVNKNELRNEIMLLIGETSKIYSQDLDSNYNSLTNFLKNIYRRYTFESQMNQKKQLFISYSSKDKSFVLKLAEDLTNHGITVWFDDWEMLPGDSLYEKIQKGIRFSGWFAIILSPDSVNSNWCKRELHNALEEENFRNKVFVIPILYRDCEIPGFLKEKVYVDLREENYNKEFSYLLRRFDIE